jgi:hypothetical protein
MFCNFFSENHSIYEISLKIEWRPKGQHMSEYGTYTLHAGLAILHALTCIHTPMRPGTHMHAHTGQ